MTKPPYYQPDGFLWHSSKRFWYCLHVDALCVCAPTDDFKHLVNRYKQYKQLSHDELWSCTCLNMYRSHSAEHEQKPFSWTWTEAIQLNMKISMWDIYRYRLVNILAEYTPKIWGTQFSFETKPWHASDSQRQTEGIFPVVWSRQ